MKKKYLFIRSKFMLPFSRKLGLKTRIEDGYVLTENDKIIEVGKYTNKKGEAILKKYGNELYVIGSKKKKNFTINDLIQNNACLMPGFVKAHGHDHESPIIGIAKDCPLTVWLDEAVNVFTGFLNEKRKQLTKRFGKSPNFITYLKARIDDIYYGITSSLVHHCNHNKYRVEEIVEANKIMYTKMFIAVGSQDRNYDKRILDIPPEIAIKRLDEYIKKFSDAPRTWIIPGPDQCFSNGPELLKLLKNWAKEHNTLIHIHSSEEPKTTQWFIETYKMTPVEYFDSINFLDEKTILAHQVNTTENDLQILKRTGVKIVHNPLANTILGSGMPPIKRFLELGIPFVISTDGSGSADNQNIISAAKCAAQYQKGFHKDAAILPAELLLQKITIEPAEFLGLNCGSLEAGKDADIILIDLTRPNLIPTRLDNLMENLIWAADGSEVKTVIANGKILKEDYEFIYSDYKTILKEVQELSELLIDYKKKSGIKITGTGAHKE
ncbi:MAG TPA: amidohydrolase family protein [bacterium]|nr:amidohydrolase family protein [bacterium]HOL46808.1 amidohydrolase family protein [bacterium]HPQ18666.1 amidohydrolase family protein [bacterium]